MKLLETRDGATPDDVAERVHETVEAVYRTESRISLSILAVAKRPACGNTNSTHQPEIRQ
jgi:hypothetical protein